MRPLNTAMGWIVAFWLLAAALTTNPADRAFYACMAGALVTVCVWAVVYITLIKTSGGRQ